MIGAKARASLSNHNINRVFGGLCACVLSSSIFILWLVHSFRYTGKKMTSMMMKYWYHIGTVFLTACRSIWSYISNKCYRQVMFERGHLFSLWRQDNARLACKENRPSKTDEPALIKWIGPYTLMTDLLKKD